MMNEWIISSSLLIAAVLVGRRLLRGRISLRLQYALWLVVLIRLVLPVQLFTSDFGAGSIAEDVDISAPVRQVYTSAREDDYEREYDAAYRQVVAEYQASMQTYDPVIVEQEAQTRVQRSMELDLKQLLYGVWFAGMVVMTSVIVSCNVHLGLTLKRRRWEFPVSDSLLPVYVTEAVPTPCIFGFFRPAIYLTPEAAADEQVRRHVLAHELTHYRHLDHIWSVLRSVCLVLHWYNPLVWAAARVSRADAELACDEGALAQLGEEHRADYGRTLIGLTCSDHGGSMFVTATTMTGSARSITERIKLLMKRPRNTVLALTAVVLVGALIVGCTFAGAPETTEPTETTAPGVDNDMSYDGTELPIPENPGALGLLDANGIIVFPGTQWNMTEEELLEALDIQEYGIFSGMRGFHIPEMTVFGYPAGVGIYFEKHTDDAQWGLSGVYIHFQTEEDADAVRQQIIDELGTADAWTSGIAFETWRSDVRIEDLISPEAYAQFQEKVPNNLFFDGEASSVSWYGPGNPNYENTIIFESGIPRALQIEASLGTDQAAEVAALFGPDGDSWYLSALTTLYSDRLTFDAVTFFCSGQTSVALTGEEEALIAQTYGEAALNKPIFRMTAGRMGEVLRTYLGLDLWDVDTSGFLYCPETDAYLRVKEENTTLTLPSILSCEALAQDQVRMIYTLPGSDQRYAATLLKGENWKVYSNQLIITAPIDARGLTEEEIEQVSAAFQASIYDEELGESRVNPLACIVNDYYDDVTELDRSAFLRNYPYSTDGAQEEFELLKKKYPDFFEDWEWGTMPIPIHCYDPKDLNNTLQAYADIRWEDLIWDDGLHYLEETGCFYNYTSDFGLMGFQCTGGWVYDGGAMLVSRDAVLYLTERNGAYYIQSHLPAIVAQVSQTAYTTPEEEIADTLETFFLAYEENVNLYADHGYDHLTVLSADGKRTVTYKGETVPLSDFCGNIEYLHGKEAYWKHVRKDQGIVETTFQVTTRVYDIRYDGDAAVVQVGVNLTFYYEGLGAPSGIGEAFEVLLVPVDDNWLIADITEQNDWFDAENKNDPDFDPDALIASYIP